MDFLNKLEEQREFHRQGYNALRQTIAINQSLQDFDFYFDFVLKVVDIIVKNL